ncbi:hypothetical protein GCM10022221_40360 [Actinocorallia aurea]
MHKLVKGAAVGLGAAAVLALAQPASAASFGPVSVGDGTVGYNDGTDSFCAAAYNTEGARWVQVTLVPISQAGPTLTWTDYNSYYGDSGSTCRSLATAYEDTYYRADIRTYWGERGTTVTRADRFFYS